MFKAGEALAQVKGCILKRHGNKVCMRDACGETKNVVSQMMLQVVPRSGSDNVLEACLASTHQQPHARFCTTLGDGDDRYDPLTTSFGFCSNLHTLLDASQAEVQHLSCCQAAAM